MCNNPIRIVHGGNRSVTHTSGFRVGVVWMILSTEIMEPCPGGPVRTNPALTSNEQCMHAAANMNKTGTFNGIHDIACVYDADMLRCICI